MSTPNADTRTRILEAARRLFHEQGYAATGISTILREADVNSGSLYHFFSSKEELLAGVLEHYLGLLDPMVMEPAERTSQDPIERVFGLLQLYRTGLEASGCRMGCPIGNLALEVADSHPEIRRFIEQNFRNWIARVESWLVAAGDRLPAEVDRTRLAQLVLTVMEGGIMQARAAASLAPFDASVAELRRHFDLLEDRPQTTRARRGGSGPDIRRSIRKPGGAGAAAARTQRKKKGPAR